MAFWFTVIHIIFCLVDTLYIPYGILYYVNRVYFQCLLVPHGLEVRVRLVCLNEREICIN